VCFVRLFVQSSREFVVQGRHQDWPLCKRATESQDLDDTAPTPELASSDRDTEMISAEMPLTAAVQSCSAAAEGLSVRNDSFLAKAETPAGMSGIIHWNATGSIN
jgi:hypothetical protein